jgi:predicted choloylglycine hydrolase
MFSHIVMLKFSKSDDAFFDAIADYTDRLREACDGVEELRFVRNEASRSAGFSHGFISRFVDEAAHDRYQNVQVHQELKQFMMPHVSELVVLDSTSTHA